MFFNSIYNNTSFNGIMRRLVTCCLCAGILANSAAIAAPSHWGVASEESALQGQDVISCSFIPVEALERSNAAIRLQRSMFDQNNRFEREYLAAWRHALAKTRSQAIRGVDAPRHDEMMAVANLDAKQRMFTAVKNNRRYLVLPKVTLFLFEDIVRGALWFVTLHTGRGDPPVAHYMLGRFFPLFPSFDRFVTISYMSHQLYPKLQIAKQNFHPMGGREQACLFRKMRYGGTGMPVPYRFCRRDPVNNIRDFVYTDNPHMTTKCPVIIDKIFWIPDQVRDDIGRGFREFANTGIQFIAFYNKRGVQL